MDQKYRNCGIIVAAGRGSRVKSAPNPKQYLKIQDYTVLHHSISTLSASPVIDAIITVIHPDDESLYQDSIPENCHKLLPPIHGAPERQGSVLNGLRALSSYQPETVYIHDAARPFVNSSNLETLSQTLKTYDGALLGIPVVDTLKRVQDKLVDNTIPRANLWRAQTPQAFHYQKILEAHEAATSQASDNQFTDDASIAEWYGLSVAIVPGDENNRKLTTSEDFNWAKKHLETTRPQGSYRMGTGYDVHAFEGGDHVTLCGINIPHEKSLKGHSDADVAMHALTDALFGAIADGDIGVHFPPSEPKWKNCDSAVFLKYAVDRVRERGGEIQNVDITIICEMPKIGPHSDAMREKLSEIMDFPKELINVKATTSEKLGFTGREEGIASMATASVWLPE